MTKIISSIKKMRKNILARYIKKEETIEGCDITYFTHEVNKGPILTSKNGRI